MARPEHSWDRLHTFIAELHETQAARLTDESGWTVKDHLMHLAIWEDSVNALLQHESRAERVGVAESVCAARDFDQINAVIQQTHRDRPLPQVFEYLRTVHVALVEKLTAMPEEEIRRPYSAYEADSSRAEPIIAWLTAIYAHYDEHIPWMEAILKRPQQH